MISLFNVKQCRCMVLPSILTLEISIVMKQNFLFSILLLFWLSSCTNSALDEPNSIDLIDCTIENAAFKTSQDAVSVAIKAFSDVYGSDVQALSRSTQDIRIYNGANEVSNPEPGSIYVINFSSGGYALVPADAEIDAIYGISDLGHFEVNPLNPNDIGSFILNLASGYSLIPTGPIDITPIDSTGYNLETVEYQGIVCHKKTEYIHESSNGELLTTQWAQGTPYNLLCPTFNKYDKNNNCTTLNYAAGCVPIAMGQIMAFHQFPNTHTDRAGINYSYDWDLIMSTGDHTEVNAASLETSKFIYSISKDIISTWGEDYSTASVSAAPKLFREFNYDVPSSNYTTYDFDTIKTQIKNELPVLVEGHISPLPSSGHAWVIDGFFHRCRVVTYTDAETGDLVGTEKFNNTELVHCNWGWRENPSGYFTSGLFDSYWGNYSYRLKMIKDIKPIM